jgi:predicted RNase H-like HicB family nuclease
VTELPGALAYGDTRDEAIQAVATLVYRIIADRVEHREMAPPNTVSFEHAA